MLALRGGLTRRASTGRLQGMTTDDLFEIHPVPARALRAGDEIHREFDGLGEICAILSVERERNGSTTTIRIQIGRLVVTRTLPNDLLVDRVTR